MGRFGRALSGGALVQTYSPLGQLVGQVPVAEAATRLALSALAPGRYHVVLRGTSGERLATRPLVVNYKGRATTRRRLNEGTAQL